jgi:hypothetical protein
MSELATFQRAFLSALARPDAELGPLAIYRNTSLSGAVEALCDNYPVVRAILGEPLFRDLAAEYAQAQPPDSPVLALYGRRFPDWIAAKGLLSYLGDVGRIERLHLEALFAADALPLQPDALAEVDPETWNRTRLNLHPAARYHWSPLPAMSIWLAHQDGTPVALEPEWRAECALFTRPWSTVEARILDAPAKRFLSAIRVGETVGAAALVTAERHPDADLGGLFRTLLEAGAFAAPLHPKRNV